jgi:hypothetical protein
MARKDSLGGVEPACLPVIPLSVALYVSDGLIFQFYDGGQPARQFSIHWERTKADCRERGRGLVSRVPGRIPCMTRKSDPASCLTCPQEFPCHSRSAFVSMADAVCIRATTPRLTAGRSTRIAKGVSLCTSSPCTQPSQRKDSSEEFMGKLRLG